MPVLLPGCQMFHHGPVEGQAGAKGVHHKARRPVVPQDHGGIVVKGEDQGLLVFGAAQLAQLLPAGEGGEKGLPLLIGQQLELDGGALPSGALSCCSGAGEMVTGAKKRALEMTMSSTASRLARLPWAAISATAWASSGLVIGCVRSLMEKTS